MTFKEILSRLTGINVPVFGLSWNPPEAERTVAKRVMTYLEDRRVLYAPSEMEVPGHCVQSVLEIRAYLTSELGSLDGSSELTASLRALRAACRKFLDTVHHEEDRIVRFGFSHGHWASWVFNGALGEMRGVFGVHLAGLAAKYGLSVEKDLAAILPSEDETGRQRHAPP
jgi:hypothetical protein